MVNLERNIRLGDSTHRLVKEIQSIDEENNILEPSDEELKLLENEGFQVDPDNLFIHVDDNDSVGIYLKEQGKTPLLTPQEEVALAKRIERGVLDPAYVDDAQEAREKLARANTRLVVSIAKRYRGSGLPFSDVIQEGNVGLMRAVDKFDYTRGYKFSSYATWWIRQAITRALSQKTRMIRIPLHKTDQIRHIYTTAQALEQNLGRRPTVEEIAVEMKCSPEKIRDTIQVSQHTLSLQDKMDAADDDTELDEFVRDPTAPDPDESVDQQLLKEVVTEELNRLTPRQEIILTKRFGLDGEGSHTLGEVATMFGLSRERIRQIEDKALRRLRHSSSAGKLRPYLE
ncbi:sigma-70 family RNA polymerase sigma factor [Candidatus Gottesmanbacteria bacterium]|nr:sigma-70 family RNA polymerase sigma factor [Candidatus Gottesmanbacteria bacterium]